MSPRLLSMALLLVCACGDAPADPGADATSSTMTGSSGSSSSSSSSTGGDDPPTGTTTPTTTAEGSGTGEADDTSAGELVPFVLACHTELTPAPSLALVCNLPRTVRECTSLPVSDAPCDDLDLDGLVDAWEDLVLEVLRPIQRLDEQESLVADPAFVLGDVGRVAPVDARVRVMIMLGYSEDYGSCGGFTAHHGDSERVALDLEPDPGRGPGGVVVVGAYTAAHENTDNDHGEVFIGAALAGLVYSPDPRTGKPRWVVFPSADKHATYATLAICEGVSPIPCLDEDCGPDDVDDPALYDRLPPIVNAGEEAAPRVTDLAALGFPGEDAWAQQDFCGGLGGTGCSSPVREKLLVDPF